MIACVFDTETTGLVENRTMTLTKQPEIIEFYGCVADLATGAIIDELDFLICPSRLPLPDKIVKITGIGDADLDGKPSFKDVSPQIFSMLEQAPLVIAHNASFDRDMVEIESERLGVQIKWPRLVCTVEATIAVKGYRLTLSALHEELFGEPFKGAHRAKADVAALLRCCVELHKRDMI